MEITSLGAGVYTVDGFLSEDECRAYIELGERLGFSAAAIGSGEEARILREARNNDRILLDDAALAARLFEKARPWLPAEIDGWSVCGFNERLRLYRYGHGQYFKWHQDGTFRRSDQEESFLTFMVYLNDDFQGGETRFRWDRAQPRLGRALVFPHRVSHQGSDVAGGIKYVLRTDVMYRALPAPAPTPAP